MQRDARAHQHVAHAGQHRAVDGGEVRHLHLLKKIDADSVLLSIARQIDLDEIAYDA